MNYIDIKRLEVSFGRKTILTDINLEVNAGDRIGIIGKNGAGKTTLIETIMGVNNAKLTGYLNFNNEADKKIKAIFQDYQYDKALTLKKLYVVYCKMNGTEPCKNIADVFKKYDLLHLMKRRYHNLSGGEKQKFKLLMCLELKPQILVLDEITTALDYEWREQIFNVLNEYLNKNPECAVLMVSHDKRELKKLTTKCYLIKDNTNFLVENMEGYFHEEY